MRSPQAGLRTVDVARRVGCSVQHVRDLEREGVLAPAARSASGYRIYTDAHVHAAHAYRSLAAGVGPVEAKTMMRAVHRLAISELLELIDQAHAGLHTERRDLDLARTAVTHISAEPIGHSRTTDAMTISELADALGIRPSALRHWDTQGLVVPDRSPQSNARRYTPTQVRDARIVHQLRHAGYRIRPLQELMPQLRLARRDAEIDVALLARLENITTRSRALLKAAAALETMLEDINSPRDIDHVDRR